MPKSSGGEITNYPGKSGSGGFKFVSLTEGSGLLFETLPEIKTEYVSGVVTRNITLSYKGKTGKKTVMEDVENDVDEPPDSDFAKSAAILFDK